MKRVLASIGAVIVAGVPPVLATPDIPKSPEPLIDLELSKKELFEIEKEEDHTLTSESKTIKLELPDKVVKTDDLYEGEEEVETEGVVGKAIKTTITTEIGSGKSKEDSLIILKHPVQKVIKKGTKPRPEPVEEITVEVSRGGDRTSAPQAPQASYAPPARLGSVVDTASQFLGVPYVYAGSTPSGFDCSGLTSYVYGLHGINLPRSSYAQAGVGTGVSLSEARPGDLLILNGGGHVGIYIGNGQLIHAPRPGKTVEVSQLAYFSLNSIRRL